jgi:2,4-diketo-3-deoxy-L-fuconate hydrolase
MKLIRFGEPGKEKPGLQLSDGSRIDASGFGGDYDEAFFASGGLTRLASWLKSNQSSAPRVAASARLGSAVCRPSKIVCIGLNYRDHAAETKAEAPKEPVLFFKATTSLVGPNDPLVRPRNSTKVDWEVELAVVIGKRALYVSKEKALDHVAGFSLHNDYSERQFQLERGGQMGEGKKCRHFCSAGSVCRYR